MTKDNEDALRSLYEVTGNVTDANTVLINRAHLRRLVQENEAKDALLRQAVEALDDARTFVGAWPAGAATTDAIRQHLDQKTT